MPTTVRPFIFGLLIAALSASCTPGPHRDAVGSRGATAGFAPQINVDLSTPKAAHETMAWALFYRNGSAYRACADAEQAGDRALVNAFAAWLDASRELWQAAAARFGIESADEIVRAVGLPDPRRWGEEILGSLPGVVYEMNGDAAAVANENASFNGGKFTRHERAWKVRPTIDQGGKAGGGISSANWTEVFARSAAWASRCAMDVAAGKFASPADAVKGVVPPLGP